MLNSFVILSVCGWGKSKCGATVRWLVGDVAPLLILPKRWFFFSFFLSVYVSTVGRHSITGNVWRYVFVADFGARHCQDTIRFEASHNRSNLHYLGNKIYRMLAFRCSFFSQFFFHFWCIFSVCRAFGEASSLAGFGRVLAFSSDQPMCLTSKRELYFYFNYFTCVNSQYIHYFNHNFIFSRYLVFVWCACKLKNWIFLGSETLPLIFE